MFDQGVVALKERKVSGKLLICILVAYKILTKDITAKILVETQFPFLGFMNIFH